jgi:hypothetical protein
LSKARRELSAALRCCFAVFFVDAVFFAADFLALAILLLGAVFFFTGLDLAFAAAFFGAGFLFYGGFFNRGHLNNRER